MSKDEFTELGQPATVPLDYQPPPDSLAGRIVLITGAANGIGRAVSAGCAEAGATVILLDKNLKRLETLYDEITEAGAAEPVIHPMNLEGVGPAEFMELSTALHQQFGRLDALVHNAAMLGKLAPLQHYDPEIWARTLHVNINAPLLLTQACMPLLARSDDARIIFTSDRTGRRGHAFWGAYGVANGALEIMMETLAAELGADSSIRVNSFDPGPVNTAMRKQAYPAENPGTLRQARDLVPCYLYMIGPTGAGLHGRRLALENSG